MKKILFGRWQDRIKEVTQKFDLIFFDPPFGATNYKWDKEFDKEELSIIWSYLKDDGVIVSFAKDSSYPILGNFRYKWYWKKNRKSAGFLSSHRPITYIEELHVFSRCTLGTKSNKQIKLFGSHESNFLEYNAVLPSKKIHPFQKPIELCKYIIEAYTKEGDYVLDICSGSGTIPLACMLMNRNFLGIEKEEEYFYDSVNRIHHKLIKE